MYAFDSNMQPPTKNKPFHRPYVTMLSGNETISKSNNLLFVLRISQVIATSFFFLSLITGSRFALLTGIA